MAEPDKKKISGFRKFLIGLIATLGVLMVLGTVLTERNATTSRKASTKPSCGDDMMAFVMSQTFIERQLRAPATASFPWYSSDGVKVLDFGDCEFRVKAYVDAQNGFGANIRTVYTMIVRYDPNGDTWHARAINMVPR